MNLSNSHDMQGSDEIASAIYEESYSNLDEYSAPVGVLAKFEFNKKVWPENKYRTYLEERVAPYLPFIFWENKTLDKDMRLFWIAVHRHEKTKPSGSLFRILNWAKGKNLYPKQVIAVLNKKA